MKHTYLTMIILFVIWGCQQEKTTVYESKSYPVGAILESYNEIPGLVKVTYRDPGDEDVILAEGDYLEGEKHGVWVEYDAKKRIPVLIQTYHKGELQGVEIKLTNGTVTEKTFFHKGQKHGQSIVYNSARKVQEVKNYQWGTLEGMVKKYYKTGELMEEALYQQGQLNGLSKWYDQEGNIKFQYMYAEGQLVDENPEVTDN